MFVSAAHSVFYDLDIYFVCYKCDSRLILAFNTTLSVRCILFVCFLLIFKTKKRSVIGYFENRDSEFFKNFEKVAEEFRDDCDFHVGFG